MERGASSQLLTRSRWALWPGAALLGNPWYSYGGRPSVPHGPGRGWEVTCASYLAAGGDLVCPCVCQGFPGVDLTGTSSPVLWFQGVWGQGMVAQRGAGAWAWLVGVPERAAVRAVGVG